MGNLGTSSEGSIARDVAARPSEERNERLSISFNLVGFNLVNQIFQPFKSNLLGNLTRSIRCVLSDELAFSADWKSISTLVFTTADKTSNKVVHVDFHVTRQIMLTLDG